MTAADQPSGVAPPAELRPVRESLTRGDCLALLAPGGYGRVAATMYAVPIIIPVTFTLVGEDVIFSPGSSEGLSRAVADSVVAFETDHTESEGNTRWGVHATGVARMVTDEPDGQGFRLSSKLLTGWRSYG